MSDAFNDLISNDTWELVPHRPFQNLVASKWVYGVARLVAAGNYQQAGIDFLKTFSLVICPATIGLVLSFVVTLKWPICRLDVKNTFFHRILAVQVYMRQRLGFFDCSFPNHVCCLKKAIYGSKRGP